jgi:hypothetical protein
MDSTLELFCLSCGCEMPEPLRRTASLRCHDCREAGEPISLELALRARAMVHARAVVVRDQSAIRSPAA